MTDLTADFPEKELVLLLEQSHELLASGYCEALRLGQPASLLGAIDNICRYLLVVIDDFKVKWMV